MLKSALNGVLSLLLVSALSTAHADEALQPVDIAIGEWKPFVTRYVEGYGEVAEIVTVVLERMGYRPNYIFMPWGQAEAKVRQNESDIGPRASFPYRSTAKRRAEFLVSSDPVFETCIKFFYNKDKVPTPHPLSISAVTDLARFKLGFVGEEGGYQYPEKLRSVLNKGATKVGSLFELFSKLVDPAAENVQVVPEVAAVGQDLLYELFPEQQFSIGIVGEAIGKHRPRGCLLPVEYFFLMSRRNPNNAEFMRRFDVAHSSVGDETKTRIKRKAQARPSLRTPALFLRAHGSESLIRGRDDDGTIYYLPRGTRGLLLNWKPPRDAGSNSETQAEVRIISGPYRGKRLVVDGRHVELE